VGTGWKAVEKIQNVFGRNTAATKSPELPETGRFRAGLFHLGYKHHIQVAYFTDEYIFTLF
jgi:hypothetical protein